MAVLSWRRFPRALRVSHLGRKFAFSLAFLLALGLFQAHAEDIKHYYDEAGRLIQTTTPAGSVQYRYDSLGTLIEVVKVSATSTSPKISEFTPNAGRVGTPVTIIGQGFSTTLASNLVKFNGTTATVLSATTNVINTVVPAGATTGKITVKVGTQTTATSAQAFTVTTNATDSPPQITGFSPTLALPGTNVTVTGRGFISRTESRLHVNGNRIDPLSLTDTEIVFTVPPRISGGKITVTNRFGRTDSAADFFVVPEGVALDAVVHTGRIEADGPRYRLPEIVPNGVALLHFDGSEGEMMGAGFTSIVSNGNWTVSTLSPRATDVLGPRGGSHIDTSTPAFRIAVPGTQAFVIWTSPTTPLAMTVVVSRERQGTIEPDGPAALFFSDRAGENGRFSFSGVAGRLLGLAVTGSLTPTNDWVPISLQNSDGVTLGSCSFVRSPGQSCDLPPLPETGVYSLSVDPAGTSTVNLSLLLSNDDTGVLMAGAPARNFNAMRPGRNARYTFEGVADQGVAIAWTGNNIAAGTLAIQSPDGQTRSYPLGSNGVPVAQDVIEIPGVMTGTYKVGIHPDGLTTGQMSVSLVGEAVDTLVVDAAPKAFALGTGQNGRYVFNGTQNQTLGLGIIDVVTSPPGGRVDLSILKPDNTLLVNCGATLSAGTSCDLPPLPVSGAYKVIVNPAGTNAAQFSLLLSSDQTGTLVYNGAPLTFNTARVGQNARYTFQGAIGDAVSLNWTGNTFGATTLRVIDPAGQETSSLWLGGVMGAIDYGPLTLAGTYTVFITPAEQSVGQMQFSAKADDVGSVVIDGPVKTVALSAGQNGRYTFSGVQNQMLGLGITDQAHAGQINIRVERADNGALLFNCFPVLGSIGDCDLPPLPASGLYRIVVNPQGFGATSLNLLLSSDVTGSLMPAGTTQTFSSTRVGRNARFGFDVPATENASITWSGNTFGGPGSFIEIHSPSGSVLNQSTLVGVPQGNTPSIQLTAGTGYSVFINPRTGATGQIDIKLQMGRADLTLPAAPSVGAVELVAGGFSVPINYEVRNTAGGIAQAPWTDKAYLSADTVLDVSDVEIGSTAVSASQGTGSVNRSMTLLIPADASGTVTVILAVDRSNNVTETSEDNNTRVFTVVLPTKPDLRVTNLSVSNIRVGASGNYLVDVGATVTNAGTSSTGAGSFATGFYLSTDGVLNNPGDFPLTTIAVGTLAPGASVNLFETADLDTTGPGNYTVFVEADTWNQIPESDDTNNVRSAALVLPQKPDLVITTSSVGAITVLSTGAYSIPVTFTIRNQGGLPATASWNDAVYLSTNTTLDTNDLYLGQASRSTNLAPGAEYQFNRTVQTSTTQASGAYTLFMKADGTNSSGRYSNGSRTVESNENNNTASRSVNLPNR